MTFSWSNALKKAEQLKIRREKTKALTGHPDFRLEHPDEFREAQQDKFTALEKRVKEKLKKHTDLAMARRARRVSA